MTNLLLLRSLHSSIRLQICFFYVHPGTRWQICFSYTYITSREFAFSWLEQIWCPHVQILIDRSALHYTFVNTDDRFPAQHLGFADWYIMLIHSDVREQISCSCVQYIRSSQHICTTYSKVCTSVYFYRKFYGAKRAKSCSIIVNGGPIEKIFEILSFHSS
jgi:hypothetical protein